MADFTISFLNRDFSTLHVQPKLSFTVERYSWSAWGGPKDAALTGYGSEHELWKLIEKIRQPIIIQDKQLGPVWWGYINEIHVRVGAISIGVSLDNMFNKIAVAYTDNGTRATTGWATDTDSTGEYGTKELLLTIADAASPHAVQQRNEKLLELKFPQPHFEATLMQGEEGSLSARLLCRGWYDTLDWRYYTQTKGLVAYTDTGVGQQKLGLSYSTSTIYFSSASFGDSASPRLKNEIADTACGLSEFAKDDVIYVSEGGANTGLFTILEGTRAGDDITVEESVTTTASNSGSTFRLTSACGLFQSFQQTTGSNWNAHEAHVRIQKIGDIATAGGSGVKLQILTDSGGSPTATVTASGSVAASDVAADMRWIRCEFTASGQITNSTQYWLHVTPIGITSGSAYYLLDVNEELGYTDGALEISNGNQRHARTVDADLLFRVVGKSETTQQLRQIQQGYSEFFRNIDVENESGLETEQFRVGDTTSLREFEKVLALGTSSSLRLLAEVTEDRRLRVYEESASTGSSLAWTTRGQFEDKYGYPVPKQKCTVGQWARLKDIIPGTANFSAMVNPGVFFVEENEYFAQSDQLVPRAKHARSPWELTGIEQG